MAVIIPIHIIPFNVPVGFATIRGICELPRRNDGTTGPNKDKIHPYRT